MEIKGPEANGFTSGKIFRLGIGEPSHPLREGSGSAFTAHRLYDLCVFYKFRNLFKNFA